MRYKISKTLILRFCTNRANCGLLSTKVEEYSTEECVPYQRFLEYPLLYIGVVIQITIGLFESSYDDSSPKHINTKIIQKFPLVV